MRRLRRSRLNAAARDLYDALADCLRLLHEMGPTETTLTEHAAYVALARAESDEAYLAALKRYKSALDAADYTRGG